MPQRLRILFVGGSTMRGYSISGPYQSFAYQIIKELNNGSEIFVKDQILINEVRDFLENAGIFDVFVIQVGVGDSLRKKRKRKRKSDSHSIFLPRRPTITKLILKRILYFIGIYRANTGGVSFTSCIESISKIAVARQTKVIWLGSIITPVLLTKPEKVIKQHYCRSSFVTFAERNPDRHSFIDVDEACSELVDNLDIFHLNQEGHDVVAALIREKLDQWV